MEQFSQSSVFAQQGGLHGRVQGERDDDRFHGKVEQRVEQRKQAEEKQGFSRDLGLFQAWSDLFQKIGPDQGQPHDLNALGCGIDIAEQNGLEPLDEVALPQNAYGMANGIDVFPAAENCGIDVAQELIGQGYIVFDEGADRRIVVVLIGQLPDKIDRFQIPGRDRFPGNDLRLPEKIALKQGKAVFDRQLKHRHVFHFFGEPHGFGIA